MEKEIIKTDNGFRVASHIETVARQYRRRIVAFQKMARRQYQKIIPPVWRKKLHISLLVLIVVIIIVIQFLGAESPQLTVNFYDVGQGDAIHIRAKDGFDVLIDGGPDGRIVEKLGRNMPFWDKTIDLMMITHPHADHLVGQISVLERFEVKRVLTTGVLHTTDEYLMWLDKIRSKNLSMEIVQAGMNYEVGSGRLEILWPIENFSGKRVVEKGIGEGGGLNDTSIVARLIFGKTSFLFMGDAGAEVEKELLSSHFTVHSSQLTVDVLKVGHHGSKYSSSKDFIKEVAPKYAVIQVGKKNDFGHPHFQTLWRLSKAGAKILRNDKNGDIMFESDGESIRVSPPVPLTGDRPQGDQRRG